MEHMQNSAFNIHQSGTLQSHHAGMHVDKIYENMPDILRCFHDDDEDIAFECRQDWLYDRIVYTPNGWAMFEAGESTGMDPLYDEALCAFTTVDLGNWLLSRTDNPSGEPCTSVINDPVDHRTGDMREEMTLLHASVAARMYEIESRSKFYNGELYTVVDGFRPNLFGVDYKSLEDYVKRDIRPGYVRSVVGSWVSIMNRTFVDHGFLLSSYGDNVLLKVEAISPEYFLLRRGGSMTPSRGHRGRPGKFEGFFPNLGHISPESLDLFKVISIEPNVAEVFIRVLNDASFFHAAKEKIHRAKKGCGSYSLF